MGDIVSERDLIKKYSDSGKLLHLAKTPIADKDKCFIKSYPQLYAIGFNAGGRPDGLWVSRGSAWIEKAKELDNPKFPVCCYIYNVSTCDDARILHVGDEEQFLEFDKNFPSYWINLDYFEVDFIDYLNGHAIRAERKYKLDLDKLRKRGGETIRDVMVSNNIIFNTAESALAGCEFYKRVKIPIERFKYKDWAAVAEKYQGIVFDTWNIADPQMKYLWFQSLDVASGCIWDVSAISNIDLLYNKISMDTWQRFKK